MTACCFLCLSGNLHVGRWGTSRSRDGTCVRARCRSCPSSSAAFACWAADPRLSSSSTPSSRNMEPTSSSQPLWEVRQKLYWLWHWIKLVWGLLTSPFCSRKDFISERLHSNMTWLSDFMESGLIITTWLRSTIETGADVGQTNMHYNT